MYKVSCSAKKERIPMHRWGTRIQLNRIFCYFRLQMYGFIFHPTKFWAVFFTLEVVRVCFSPLFAVKWKKNLNFAALLSYGVMVALEFLVLSVVVRIRLGQQNARIEGDFVFYDNFSANCQYQLTYVKQENRSDYCRQWPFGRCRDSGRLARDASFGMLWRQCCYCHYCPKYSRRV